MEALEVQTPDCKAIIQEGPRKGQPCQFPPLQNKYCGRHDRNRIYDEGIANGKIWCRFFFRGCDNTVLKLNTGCTTCKGKKHEGKLMCAHEGCSHHTESEGFCKKHERDVFYNEEKEKNIKYCDVARGCFEILKNDKKSCENCLEKQREREQKRFDTRKMLQNALKDIGSDKRICVDCGATYDTFKTSQNYDSNRCIKCNKAQNIQESKRERVCNYKNEKFRNKVPYYKAYINSAIKRNYEFLLNFEEFSELVIKPCYYCQYYKESETNGIDRVDNSKGYTKENTVPCCEKCNNMKNVYHPHFFIEKCRIIGNSEFPDREFYKKWEQYYLRTNFRNYTAYRREAVEKRNLFFEITQEQWDYLTRQPCYLCGYKQMNGIGLDRVDNSVRGYTFANLRPCCGSCNLMKGETELMELIEHCKRVAATWKEVPGAIQKVEQVKLESKTLQVKPENRKVWKSLGLYYTILNNKEDEFAEFYKEVLKDGEFALLCADVKKDPKEKALEYLARFLQNLKDRRKRRAAKNGL